MDTDRTTLTDIASVTEFPINRQVNPCDLAWQFSMVFDIQAAIRPTSPILRTLPSSGKRSLVEVDAFVECDFIAS